MGILAVLVIVAAAVALVVTSNSHQTTSSVPSSVDAEAIQQWWAVAGEPFTELQESLGSLQRVATSGDESAVLDSCQQMHDIAAAELQAHLPTPNSLLTSELQAATEDAHSGAHMCLAAAAGSLNSYVGEFMSTLELADKHMKAAEEIVNEALIATI